jgi:hypothetical protein
MFCIFLFAVVLGSLAVWKAAAMKFDQLRWYKLPGQKN